VRRRWVGQSIVEREQFDLGGTGGDTRERAVLRGDPELAVAVALDLRTEPESLEGPVDTAADVDLRELGLRGRAQLASEPRADGLQVVAPDEGLQEQVGEEVVVAFWDGERDLDVGGCVELGGSSGPRASAAVHPAELRLEESGLEEAVEVVLGGVAVDVEALGDLVDGHRPVALGDEHVDGSAALVRENLRHRLTRPMPFAVASTGTWVVTMAAGADVTGLPENRSCLVNVDALSSPVPCGLFLGGREYAQLTEGASSAAAIPGDITAVIESGALLVPPVGSYGGPFAGRPLGQPRGPQPGSESEIVARASLYLALMTDYCFGLIKAKGPVIVEGSLTGNEIFLAALATLRRPETVLVSNDPTGTVSGAARLAGEEIPDPLRVAAPLSLPFDAYRTAWREALPA